MKIQRECEDVNVVRRVWEIPDEKFDEIVAELKDGEDSDEEFEDWDDVLNYYADYFSISDLVLDKGTIVEEELIESTINADITEDGDSDDWELLTDPKPKKSP